MIDSFKSEVSYSPNGESAKSSPGVTMSRPPYGSAVRKSDVPVSGVATVNDSLPPYLEDPISKSFPRIC